MLAEGMSPQAVQKLTGLPEKEVMDLVDKHQFLKAMSRYSLNSKLNVMLKKDWDKIGLSKEIQERHNIMLFESFLHNFLTSIFLKFLFFFRKIFLY